MERPSDVSDSHGWLVRLHEDGHNDALCPSCYATVDYSTDGEYPCPNGCKIEVCRDYLCPWCVYGGDPFCEDK